MKGLSGLITTPMWREFIDYALAKVPEESFTQPYIPTDVKPILRGLYVDPSALLATPDASSTVPAIDPYAMYNSVHSELFYIDRSDPTGPSPANPSSDGQFKYWEYSVELWKQSAFAPYLAAAAAATTTASSSLDTEEPERRPRRSRDRSSN